MKIIAPIAALLTLLLAACGPGSTEVAEPREPGPDALGHFCRMTLAEHKGPKGQILPRGWKEPVWFSSVRDALTYVEQDIVSDREISGFWVNDMGQGTWEQPAPGSWIDARAALYVVGSSKSSGMGPPEAVPFKERKAAEVFAGQFGGNIVDYRSARQAMMLEPDSAGETVKEGGT
jgi:copper chaperone NosL